MKNISVFTAKKAIKEFKESLVGFQDIQSRINRPEVNGMEQEPTMTLNSYLASTGKPAQFSVKQALANKMGMSGYNGSKDQDSSLLMALNGKNQNEQMENQSKNEMANKDKEYSLKEKELNLKEQEMKNNKIPSSDDIANSLMSKIK